MVSPAYITGPERTPASGSRLRSEIEQAAMDFEAYVLKLLLGEMRKGIGEGGLLQSRSMRGYEVFMDEALSQRAAEAGTFGLAEQLLREWETKA